MLNYFKYNMKIAHKIEYEFTWNLAKLSIGQKQIILDEAW